MIVSFVAAADTLLSFSMSYKYFLYNNHDMYLSMLNVYILILSAALTQNGNKLGPTRPGKVFSKKRLMKMCIDNL